MNVMKLTFEVCCAVICLQLSTVAAHAETEIEELHYTREETVDPVIEGEMQLTDKFEFQIAGSSSKNTTVSLFLFDIKERVWVEASVKKEEKQTCSEEKNECQKTITLSKPLIGYDLLKPSGCGDEKFKQQPFTKERWGYREEKEDRPQCYMVTVSINDQSVSQMYPDNCVEEEASITNVEEAQPSSDSSDGHNIQKRNTYGTSITKFTKDKINNDRKFVCKVAHTHMGASTSLGNVILGADVKVYYKKKQQCCVGKPSTGLGLGSVLWWGGQVRELGVKTAPQQPGGQVEQVFQVSSYNQRRCYERVSRSLHLQLGLMELDETDYGLGVGL